MKHKCVEVGDMESEWTVFRTSIADTASKSCGLKVVRASCGSDQRTSLWMPPVREVIKLKKEDFRAWLS